MSTDYKQSQRPPKRLVRFALQADDATDLGELRHKIDLCLATEAKPYLPDLLEIDESFWEYHQKVGRRWSPLVDEKGGSAMPPYLAGKKAIARRREAVRSGRPPGIPFRLEPLLPDRKKRPPKHAPELARFNFVILTLPLYEADHKRTQCNPDSALFDIAHSLKIHCKLFSATPDMAYPNYELLSGDKSDKSDKGGFGGGGSSCKTCSDETGNFRWHLENINYDSVPPAITGSGIVIGHPDTGWTPHSELNFEGTPGSKTSPNFASGADINIIDPNSASRGEELVPSPPGQIPLTRQRYHGTATAGLMVSDPNIGATVHSLDKVRGLAPESRIVSIRCLDSVILIADINLAQAILAAVDAGAHVISISLGGYPAPVLEWAIQWAVANNLIVVAAAGNYYPLVVYPAAYPACIGVGGSTIDDEVWSGSAQNVTLAWPCPIDISAPAECVWNPFWNDEGQERRSQSSGTSFATAIVAGAAALWLQRYDRNVLIAQLGGRTTLQELFREHLRLTARRPASWNTLLNGPGILDLSGLMDRQTLPNPNTFGSPAYTLGVLTGTFNSWMDTFFGDEAQAIAAEFGNEIMHIVMSNPVVAATIQGIGTAIDRGRQIAANAAAQGQDAVDQAQQVIEDTAQDIADAAEEAANEVAEAASNAASAAVNTATNTGKKILDKITSWW